MAARTTMVDRLSLSVLGLADTVFAADMVGSMGAVFMVAVFMVAPTAVASMVATGKK
jgi:hypothetical protein